MKVPNTKLLRALEGVTSGNDEIMFRQAADSFDSLRRQTITYSGVDFLAVLGDCFRPASFKKNSPGSITNSLHKCGVAFDYNQGEKHLVLVREIIGGRTYWRTYLRVTDKALQKESNLVKQHASVKGENTGVLQNIWLFDFTQLAANLGWRRIAAHRGWELPGNWTKREFWHYEFTALASLGYTKLMAMIYSDAPAPAEPKPVPAPKTYVVQAGDSFSLIAARNKITTTALIAANPLLTLTSVIHPGQKLNLP